MKRVFDLMTGINHTWFNSLLNELSNTLCTFFGTYENKR